MNTITQPLNWFIKEQIKSGIVNSEIEAERIIITEIEEREIDRKIFKAQEQIKKGEYFKFDDELIDNFLKSNRKKYLSNN